MKKILMIIPFENIYPPKNGGMQRCFHIFHQLSKYFDLTVVTHNKKENFLLAAKYYPPINNAHIYSTNGAKETFSFLSSFAKRVADAIFYRWLVRDLKTSADGSFMKFYLMLKQQLLENEFDYIILENLNLTAQAKWMRKYSKNAAIIFDAYNVESLLAKQKMVKTENLETEKEYEAILGVEKNLYKIVDGIFCCSQVDLDSFEELNNNKIRTGYVLPNGVDTTFFSHSVNTNERQLKNVLFCGSLDYEPNRIGLLWFYKHVWPLVTAKMHDLILNIVGRGDKGPYSELINDSTTNFIGEVEYVTPWYRKCNVAIAPLLQGSGTRLKILEAMSLGNPMVSTAIGAEGIECVSGRDILIADEPADFADKIISLVSDPGKSTLIRDNARKLVEDKYSWDKIGSSIASFLESV